MFQGILQGELLSVIFEDGAAYSVEPGPAIFEEIAGRLQMFSSQPMSPSQSGSNSLHTWDANSVATQSRIHQNLNVARFRRKEPLCGAH